ncbi:MAG: TetR/AcrR family transcriptional regulator [Gammaproteobacteria bacterium]|nr:TetR/AcrR family transcriptional regulator [Gammaproteobacteria bacterium]MBQ0774237.1 TetR/AcrR family transcriptional regulator [Gammaproteobacteria bacterium]
MARRNEHTKGELKALALDAVLVIAERDGPQVVSARKVAQEIGYAPGMLYHLFENIDDLILQANTRTVSALTDDLVRATKRQSADKAVLTMALRYLQLAQKNGRRWQLLFEHTMRNGVAVPSWYQAQTAKLFGLVEQQLVRMCPQKKSVEIQLAARAVWSAVHGVCLLSVTGKLNVGGAVKEARLVESLVQNYLHGWKSID